MCKKEPEEWGTNERDVMKHIAVDHEYVMKYLKRDFLIDPERNGNKIDHLRNGLQQ